MTKKELLKMIKAVDKRVDNLRDLLLLLLDELKYDFYKEDYIDTEYKISYNPLGDYFGDTELIKTVKQRWVIKKIKDKLKVNKK